MLIIPPCKTSHEIWPNFAKCRWFLSKLKNGVAKVGGRGDVHRNWPLHACLEIENIKTSFQNFSNINPIWRNVEYKAGDGWGLERFNLWCHPWSCPTLMSLHPYNKVYKNLKTWVKFQDFYSNFTNFCKVMLKDLLTQRLILLEQYTY